ncbi:endonuclease V isoform X2 [Eurytemora carolleeae]|uniref:endonuclease V isoform X2 n=1 Tax=Eurytemora carolleeae TaxID=1294199 RepID=UPI000C788983|nr:endonuclease V isoform X2 [Eurytemora carolleeae]|eukprot:XP_023326472.1 endonuclease V-like isoform X2 [Eurytemora affinis]
MEDNTSRSDNASDLNDMERTKAKWLTEQEFIKSKVVTLDDRDWDSRMETILVGGLDISFIVGDDVNACACYVVVNKKLEVVYQKTKMVQMTAPYIPGFLAFREANFLCDLVQEQELENPEVSPDLLMLDGNGILHPNRAGVLLGKPCIGVAKNLHKLPELEHVTNETLAKKLNKKGDIYMLSSVEGEILGAAVRTGETCVNPVFVSVGSGISLDSAVKLTLTLSKYRIPEPTRQADMISREFLRVHYPTERQLQPTKKHKEGGRKSTKRGSTNE